MYNPIKRLLRTWLRLQLAKNYIEDEAVFRWIYSAPLSQWKVRLWFVTNGFNLRVAQMYVDWVVSCKPLPSVEEMKSIVQGQA